MIRHSLAEGPGPTRHALFVVGFQGVCCYADNSREKTPAPLLSLGAGAVVVPGALR
jgi:hypothetical protein